jgi:hypothetical protein
MFRSLVALEPAAAPCAAPPRAGSLQGLTLLGLCLVLTSACTEPVFRSDQDGSVDAAGQPSGPEAPVTPGGTATLMGPMGCVDPSCSEGGAPVVDDDAGFDAGTNAGGALDLPDAGLDELRAKWVNRYAARSALFSYGDLLKSSAKLLSIVTIAPDDQDGLIVTEEMCYYEGGWNFVVSGQLQYTYVESRGSAKLNYSADHFDSEMIKVHIGYGPAPSECRAGATVPKGGEQTWITGGTCDCPRSLDPPTSPRDCRLTDPEKDMKAGASFRATVDTSVIMYRATQEERVLFRNGFRANGRLYADREFDDTTSVLDCTVDNTPTKAADCPGGNAKNCPSKYNKVELVPIKDTYDCKRVIVEELGLFASPLPPYPEGCPADVASGTARSLPAQP